MSPFADPQLNFGSFSAGFRPAAGPETEGYAPADWKAVMNRLEALGPNEIIDRSETARRIIREQGVACHIVNAAEGFDAPWDLDILPLAISAAEWRGLETGLIQRARLLNLVLRDLYGFQHCLRNGWVPAPLVYANPNYLRGCQGVRIPTPAGGSPDSVVYIPFYAVDLARSQDGRWWVLADRTQAPAGFGFALENRAVVSRVLPELMRELQPRSIEGMVPLVRRMLMNLAPGNRDNPTIVVMTPGPHSESYFEHTYIARMLGCTLAEGEDLTVRDRRVFIKTLEGLRPVDVILRRVNDAFCDPLEFQSASLLGVPGLLEAVRAGHVAVANALGCGLAEMPALMPFLPGLCQQMLGEELLLPTLATWWCGGVEELHHVQEHRDRVALRSAFTLETDARYASADFKSLLETQLVHSPYDVVGQEEVILSQVPSLKEDRFGSAPFVLRAFLVWDGNSFQVMPGGLARLPHRRKLASTAMPLHGGSKDVWVLPDGSPGGEPERAGIIASIVTERPPIDLPSSAADHLFWLGRYSERLEHKLRVIRCVIGCLTDNTGVSTLKRLPLLATLLERLEITKVAASGENLREELGQTLLAVVSEPSLAGGVRDLIERIHRSAFAVRDRLSVDTSRLLNRLKQDAALESGSLNLLAVSSALDTLILDLAAFSGMEMENMTRGHGWRFLDMGRRMERSVNLAELLQVVLTWKEGRELLYEPLLEICDSVITYRRRHFSEIRLHGVLALLLLEPDNPRSQVFQLNAMQQAAAHLPEEPNPEGIAKVRRRIDWMIVRLRALEIVDEDAATDEQTALFSACLTEISAGLLEVSDLLTQVYFSHIVPRVN